MIKSLDPKAKGRGFFKKTEKERVTRKLNHKKKVLKKGVIRKAILENSSKKIDDSIKKASEKAKAYEEALKKL